jgi:hypothetical protein
MFVVNYPFPVGGAEVHALHVATALAACGHSCGIVGLTNGDPATSTQHPFAVIALDGNRIYHIGTICRLSHVLRAQEPQVIISVEQRPLLFAVIARALAGSRAPLMVINHNYPALLLHRRQHNHPRSWPQIPKALDRAFHFVDCCASTFADAFVYVSQNQREVWERQLLLGSGRL